jgi:hypothetical protein
MRVRVSEIQATAIVDDKLYIHFRNCGCVVVTGPKIGDCSLTDIENCIWAYGGAGNIELGPNARLFDG